MSVMVINGEQLGVTRRGLLAGLAVAPAAGWAGAAFGAAQAGGGNVGAAQVISPAAFGMTGVYAQDATDRMQAMFDQAPDGAVIDFSNGAGGVGDYRVTRTIVVTKGISLRAHGSRIVGTMRDNQTDLLRYEPSAEMRGVSIEGMRLAFNSGGRDALSFAGGDTGVIENVVSRCSIAGGPGGYAVRLSGLGNHFNVVRDCTLVGMAVATGAVFIGSADGNKLHDNVIAGIGAGVRIRLVNGAYKTAIIGGAITSRDMGVEIVAGQQIDIERVQFEQGVGHASPDRNQARYKSHIVVAGAGTFPSGEEVRDVRIMACNFGGGTNQDGAITLVAHARDILIDDNYFASPGTGGVDVRILAPTVSGTVVGQRNRAGGARGGISRGAPNAIDPKDLLVVADNGTATYGAYKSGEALALASGWTAQAGFAFWKHSDDVLRFRSTLKAGVVVPGTRLGRLPPGFRPRTEVRLTVPTSDDAVDARIAISPDGVISVRRAPAGALLYFDQVAIPINGRPSYASGP